MASIKREYFLHELEVARTKEKRDAEESALRKRALLLDIEIKKLTLKKMKDST